jgi:hypothetical protein
MDPGPVGKSSSKTKTHATPQQREKVVKPRENDEKELKRPARQFCCCCNCWLRFGHSLEEHIKMYVATKVQIICPNYMSILHVFGMFT